MEKEIFDSRVNYMKRSSYCGSASLTLPAVNNEVTITITHNLGYIPFYRTYAEIDESGTIWSGGKVSELTDATFLSGLASGETYPIFEAWATTTSLTLRLYNYTSPTATGSKTVYWVIYEDYGTV